MSKVVAEFRRRYEVQIGQRYYLPFTMSEWRMEWVFDKAFIMLDDALAYADRRAEDESDVRVIDNEEDEVKA